MVDKENEQAKTPQEAAAALLSELSDEMFEQTGGDRYRSGQPLNNDPAAEHSKAQKEVKAAPPVEEQPKEEEESKDSQELLKEAKEALKKVDLSEAKAAALEQKIAELEAALTSVQPKEKVDDPFELLEKESYVPKALLEKAVALGVEKKIAEMMQPEIVKRQADAEILKLYPQYAKDYPALLEFLEKNPAISRDVEYAIGKGEHLLARKYAYTMYMAQKTAQKKSEASGKTEERREAVKQAKVDAGVITTSRDNGRSEQPAPKWPTPERMEQLKGLARRGHSDPLYRETIGVLLEEQGFPF